MTGRTSGPAPVRVITYSREHMLAAAYCSDCDWLHRSAGRKPFLACRAAAHRHVAATGHVVAVSRTETYVYGPDDGPEGD